MDPWGQAGLAQAAGGEGFLQRELSPDAGGAFNHPVPDGRLEVKVQSLCPIKVRTAVTASGGGRGDAWGWARGGVCGLAGQLLFLDLGGINLVVIG